VGTPLGSPFGVVDVGPFDFVFGEPFALEILGAANTSLAKGINVAGTPYVTSDVAVAWAGLARVNDAPGLAGSDVGSFAVATESGVDWVAAPEPDRFAAALGALLILAAGVRVRKRSSLREKSRSVQAAPDGASARLAPPRGWHDRCLCWGRDASGRGGSLVLRTIALLLALLFPLHAGATTYNLVASLDGLQETPPVATPATGSATITYDHVTNQLDWTISFSGLIGTITNAHFHGPGAPGVPAGVSRWAFRSPQAWRPTR
jgi:hypothetical protein